MGLSSHYLLHFHLARCLEQEKYSKWLCHGRGLTNQLGTLGFFSSDLRFHLVGSTACLAQENEKSVYVVRGETHLTVRQKHDISL